MIAQPPPVGVRHGTKCRRFHKQGGKPAFKCLCQTGGSADDPAVGRGGGQTHENVFIRIIIRCLRPDLFRDPHHPVRRPPQCDFPQRRQIFHAKEAAERFLRLPLSVNQTLVQTLNQLLRLQIDQLHLIRFIEHRIRNPLADGDPGDRSDDIVQTFQMLDIDGGIHVDPGFQQFINILIPFEMTAPGSVGVRQLVDQDQLRPAL